MGACIGIMAGGTGGHVFPALAVAEALRAAGAEVFWIGTRQGLEARLAPAHGFEMEWIDFSGVRGKGLATLARAPWRLGRAVAQSVRILRRRRPDVLLGMGGFVAAPGGLAARLLGVPLVIQEQNRVPGLTNRWLARLATRVFEGFPGTFPAARGAEPSGNPVRRAILELPPPVARWAARVGPLRLLVLGGSLGAQALNTTLAPALARLSADARPQVRHQAGERTLEEARAAYAAAGVEAEVSAFIEDMAEAYAWADLVVCRAGALTLAELAAAGVGSVLVPFPHAVDDHQRANAAYLVEAGAARLIIQSDLSVERLAELLAELLGERARLLAMAEAARGLARPAATETIANACLELARR
ncbi:MAG: undecaprenyldiphospho-muramoylpentapeptide beta-N-acetylglucosaminyltransferase [Chromatiaceae bacterium]|nr:undecaprenyldiphospho-muramoylpentapeptide beta-N-acetylglucosaminyltransferase [Chromatiaceae bacterium]